MLEKILENMGLTKKESGVYLALLEMGSSSVSQVANRAKINRTTGYDILESLIRKGLVSHVEGDSAKKTYTAENPESLVSYMEKKSREYKEKAQQVRNALPQLKAIYSEKGKNPIVRFYEGKKGIETVYEDTLTSSEPIRAYASVRNMHEVLPEYFPEYYRRRALKGISIRGILPATKEAIERKKFDDDEERDSRLVPIDKYDFSPEIDIYDDKVAIMSLKEEFGVIIESKEIAEAQKKIYELAWEAADKYDKKISN